MVLMYTMYWNSEIFQAMCIYSYDLFFSICLYDRYAHGTDDHFQECVCPVFKGFVITVSGLDSEERNIVKRTVESQGEVSITEMLTQFSPIFIELYTRFTQNDQPVIRRGVA